MIIGVYPGGQLPLKELQDALAAAWASGVDGGDET